MKTIFRVKQTSNFTILPNPLLRDKSLSFRARGILVMILSHSDEWEVTKQWLQGQALEGREAVSSGIRELEVAGYAVFSKERSSQGLFVQGVWTFYDSPVPTNCRTNSTAKRQAIHPHYGKPDSGKPSSGKPDSGNPAAKKNYLLRRSSSRSPILQKNHSRNGLVEDGANKTQANLEAHPDQIGQKQEIGQSPESNDVTDRNPPQVLRPRPFDAGAAYDDFFRSVTGKGYPTTKTATKRLQKAAYDAEMTEDEFRSFLKACGRQSDKFLSKCVMDINSLLSNWGKLTTACCKTKPVLDPDDESPEF